MENLSNPKQPDLLNSKFDVEQSDPPDRRAPSKVEPLGKNNISEPGPPPDSEPESFWKLYQKEQYIRVRIYPREIEILKPGAGTSRPRVRRPEPEPKPGPEPEPGNESDSPAPPPDRAAGDIVTFSKKSRMRLLRLINQVNTKYLSTPIFITCTYHEDFPEDQGPQKTDLKMFKRRLSEIVPNACWIWRLEPQKRGAPHFHFLLWSWDADRNLSSKFYASKIRKAWRNISGCDCSSCVQHACKVEPVKSYAKAMKYVSKYMAKEDAEPGTITGRRWGRSRDLPVNPITEFYMSPSEYKKFENAVASLMESGSKRLRSQLEYFLSGFSKFFLWTSPKIINRFLHFQSDQAARNRYKRYWTSGSTDPPPDELAQLARDYGHIYE